MKKKLKHALSSVFIFTFCMINLSLLPGCSLIITSATTDMMDHLSASILNSDDLSLVRDGAPAYLLMIDSLIHKDPENRELLRTAAELYASYAELFVKDRVRSKKMSDKALNYANRAACLTDHDACMLKSKTFKAFETIIANMKKVNIPAFFTLGNAWAGWIMANRDDFNAIADIARIELIMQRVVELDETYKDGAAYLYLGTLASMLPPALGGKPEQGKLFFYKAVETCKGRNLMVKVIFAKLYARMIFDRTLHDTLLKEVMAADPDVPGYTLVNTWAQVQAKELLKSADDYF